MDGLEKEKLIKILEEFGFRFFANNESGEPLMVAPNNQVVGLKVALDFVKSQMQKSNESRSIESIPSIESIDKGVEKIPNVIDKNLERETAKEERKEDNSQQKVLPAPQVESKPKNPGFTFLGDGFKPTSFDFTNIEEIEKFVEDTKGSPNYSLTWLKTLFKKFLEESNAS